MLLALFMNRRVFLHIVALSAMSLIPMNNNVTATESPVASSTGVRLAAYQGGRVAAVSYTFDDAIRDQAELAVPMLEKAGFRGTFFVIPSVVPDTDAEATVKKPGDWGGISWERLRQMSAHGHEIGNHSWSHKNLPKEDDASLKEQIEKADQRILEKIGIFPLTFCYPGNAFDDRVHRAVMQDHIAAREHLKGFGGPKFTTAEANEWVDSTIKQGQWGVVMIHAILNGYAPFTSVQIFADHLDYVKARTDQVWVDTFANIARYVQERDAVVLKVISKAPGEVVFSLDGPLTRPPFDYPLTVVVEAAKAVKASAVRVGSGRQLTVEVKWGQIQVQAVPDSEAVRVRWE